MGGVWEVLGAALLSTGAVYCLAVLWLVCGLRRPPPPRGGQRPSLSIVVAARNEEGALPACLRALRAQDYEGEWEVVLVDDRSSDRTAEIAAAAPRSWPRLGLVRIEEGEGAWRCPKKNALARGIAASRGEILLFTDADCRPPAHWASAVASHFVEGVGLVAGHARPGGGRTLGQRLLAVDNMAVGALAAGSFAMGRPLACTGRNLAYRRRVYEEVGGFAAIGDLIGGDDVYFMRLVAARTGWRQVFARRPAVSCLPPSGGWREILHQKMRHAAKGGHYGGAAAGLAGLVYAFHLLLGAHLLGWGLGLAASPWPLLAAWGARWGVDALLLSQAASPEDGRWWRYFPLLEVLYIPYVVFVAAAGRLGLFRWKN